jgi:hypothetical protein
VFPTDRGGYLDLQNFRNRECKPAQIAAGVEPLRRIYDLRHTFATFRAPCPGISTFELSRYMGASLTMIDRHYGHLAALEPSDPLLTRSHRRQGFSPVWAVFAADSFATGCRGLRPLGSINAPSSAAGNA